MKPRSKEIGGAGPLAEALGGIERRLGRIEELLTQGAVGLECLSVRQAAHVTGLSQSHVWRAIRGGRLATSNAGTQRRPVWRISTSDLAKWMDENRVQNPIPARGELRQLVERYFPKE